MPIAPDPGIEAGFRAADQQSYLQTILANTRASQENQARLKQESEQMFIDPTAFQHGDGAKLASGATPEGKLIFQSPAHFAQARDLDTRKYTEKTDLDTYEGIAKSAAMGVDAKHPAYGAVQTALGRKPLDANARKQLLEIGQLAAHQPKEGLPGYDAFGRQVTPAVQPAGLLENQVPDLTSPEGVKRVEQGWKGSQKMVLDPAGRPRQTTDWTPPGTITGIDDLAALRTLKKDKLIRPDASLVNMNDDEWAAVVERKVQLQADASGKKTTVNINAKNAADEDKGVGTKEVTKYYSFEKGFAADIPGMEKMNHSQLVQMGFYNRDTGEGAQKFAKDEKTFRTAEEHIMQSQDAVSEIAERRRDLYPDWDPKKPASSVARAKALQVWKNAWLNGTDPDVARIMALDHAAMRLQAALNPTGTRFGLGMLYYAADGSPTSSNLPFTKQSVYANIDTWKQNMFASRRGSQLTGQRSGESPSHAPPIGQPGYIPPGTQSGLTVHPQPPTAPAGAGASGGSPFKKWLQQGGGR